MKKYEDEDELSLSNFQVQSPTIGRLALLPLPVCVLGRVCSTYLITKLEETLFFYSSYKLLGSNFGCLQLYGSIAATSGHYSADLFGKTSPNGMAGTYGGILTLTAIHCGGGV